MTAPKNTPDGLPVDPYVVAAIALDYIDDMIDSARAGDRRRYEKARARAFDAVTKAAHAPEPKPAKKPARKKPSRPHAPAHTRARYHAQRTSRQSAKEGARRDPVRPLLSWLSALFALLPALVCLAWAVRDGCAWYAPW